MQDLLRRYGVTLTGAFVLLTAFWLLMLIILPNITLFRRAFAPICRWWTWAGQRTPIPSATI